MFLFKYSNGLKYEQSTEIQKTPPDVRLSSGTRRCDISLIVLFITYNYPARNNSRLPHLLSHCPVYKGKNRIRVLLIYSRFLQIPEIFLSRFDASETKNILTVKNHQDIIYIINEGKIIALSLP